MRACACALAQIMDICRGKYLWGIVSHLAVRDGQSRKLCQGLVLRFVTNITIVIATKIITTTTTTYCNFEGEKGGQGFGERVAQVLEHRVAGPASVGRRGGDERESGDREGGGRREEVRGEGLEGGTEMMWRWIFYRIPPRQSDPHLEEPVANITRSHKIDLVALLCSAEDSNSPSAEPDCVASLPGGTKTNDISGHVSCGRGMSPYNCGWRPVDDV